MKKILSMILVLGLCSALAACSTSTLSGNPVTYSNASGSISVDLPASGENDWVINEEASADVLDITDSGDTIRIQIQCLSKGQADHIASDLNTYRDYSVMNTFSEILSSASLQDTQVEVPDFITASTASTYTYDGAKGVVVFMESAKCYYTYLIMAVEEAYDTNEKALLESIATLQELTETP